MTASPPSSSATSSLPEPISTDPAPSTDSAWCTKATVQGTVVQFLASKGYLVHAADGETDKDISAENGAGPLWVIVKGFSDATPNEQTWQRFKEAVFQLLAWKADDDSGTARVAIALPDIPRYRKLVKDIAWMRPLVSFSLIWVNEKGKVTAQPKLT